MPKYLQGGESCQKKCLSQFSNEGADRTSSTIDSIIPIIIGFAISPVEFHYLSYKVTYNFFIIDL